MLAISRLFFFSLFLVLAPFCYSQTTILTGAVTDSDSQPWVAATWSASITVPGGGIAKYSNGNPVTSFSGTLDSIGTFSGTIGDNSKITPAGTTWTITIQSVTSAPPSIFNTAITGASFNLGALASRLVTAPRITSTNLVYAYNSTEILNPIAGNGYINTISQTQWAYVGNSWLRTGSSTTAALPTTSVTAPGNTPFGTPSVTTNQITSAYTSNALFEIPTSSGTNHTVVLFGSSVCAGVGASTYANSFAGMLQTALQNKGYRVYNMSIPGNSTTQMLARFYTDVVPLHPAIVLNCSGIVNDSYNVTQFKTDLLELIRLERQIGAVPMVATQYANNNFSAQNFADAYGLTQFFDAMGVESVDLWGCADSSGHYLNAALTTDGLHPTDACQSLMYSAIPLAAFDYPTDNLYTPFSHMRSAWQLTATTIYNPISIAIDSGMSSWTVAAMVKDSGVSGQAYFALNSTTDNNIRVNNSPPATNHINLAVSANATLITSAVLGTSQQYHHIAVTYHAYLNLYTLYVDGALVASAANPAGVGLVTNVYFLGNPQISTGAMVSGVITDAVVYRVALPASEIQALYQGQLIRRSLLWGSRFQYAPATATNPALPAVPGSVQGVTISGTFVYAKPPAYPTQ